MKNKFKVGQTVRVLFSEQSDHEDWQKGIVREIRQGFWGRKYVISNRDNWKNHDWIWHIVEEKNIRENVLPGKKQ